MDGLKINAYSYYILKIINFVCRYDINNNKAAVNTCFENNNNFNEIKNIFKYYHKAFTCDLIIGLLKVIVIQNEKLNNFKYFYRLFEDYIEILIENYNKKTLNFKYNFDLINLLKDLKCQILVECDSIQNNKDILKNTKQFIENTSIIINKTKHYTNNYKLNFNINKLSISYDFINKETTKFSFIQSKIFSLQHYIKYMLNSIDLNNNKVDCYEYNLKKGIYLNNI